MISNATLKELNVGWLRENIGIVSQEPVLFDCTIKENNWIQACNKDTPVDMLSLIYADYIESVKSVRSDLSTT